MESVNHKIVRLKNRRVEAVKVEGGYKFRFRTLAPAGESRPTVITEFTDRPGKNINTTIISLSNEAIMAMGVLISEMERDNEDIDRKPEG